MTHVYICFHGYEFGQEYVTAVFCTEEDARKFVDDQIPYTGEHDRLGKV